MNHSAAHASFPRSATARPQSRPRPLETARPPQRLVVEAQKNDGPANVVTDMLPYCTTEPPLKQEQVIALSDAVASIRELVILALGAAGEEQACRDVIAEAVGVETARNIVDFFAEEWEVEG
ncbi:hypothetical protein ACEQ8H_006805 [Pleosporales sp. CAS-2024a]